MENRYIHLSFANRILLQRYDRSQSYVGESYEISECHLLGPVRRVNFNGNSDLHAISHLHAADSRVVK